MHKSKDATIVCTYPKERKEEEKARSRIKFERLCDSIFLSYPSPMTCRAKDLESLAASGTHALNFVVSFRMGFVCFHSNSRCNFGATNAPPVERHPRVVSTPRPRAPLSFPLTQSHSFSPTASLAFQSIRLWTSLLSTFAERGRTTQLLNDMRSI